MVIIHRLHRVVESDEPKRGRWCCCSHQRDRQPEAVQLALAKVRGRRHPAAEAARVQPYLIRARFHRLEEDFRTWVHEIIQLLDLPPAGAQQSTLLRLEVGLDSSDERLRRG